MGEFDGKVCLVTGGARGIGKAVCAMFAAQGAQVHLVDLAAPPPGETPDACRAHACDVVDRAAVVALVEAVRAQSGRIDILVNNAAAVTRATLITDLDPREWDDAIAVNVTGVFNVTRAALPLMQRGGCIVNLASTFAHVGSPTRVAYSTTKGAILAFTRSLALDLAEAGIRVNSVSPGAIATERMILQFGTTEAASAHLAHLHPMGHLGLPQNIADAIGFLASSKASFMTGADMLVDGGYTAR
jgi:NAD(P)-dependent dehydrogenase (short-subunit alcohol dehydrogenase family)